MGFIGAALGFIGALFIAGFLIGSLSLIGISFGELLDAIIILGAGLFGA